MDREKTINYLEEFRYRRHICLAERLRTANRAVTKFYSQRMVGCEISATQFSLLMRLYYLREPTMLELAKRMETDRTTLTRNVTVLEKGGFVDVFEGKDRRSRIIQMTEKGFDALSDALPRWIEAQAEMRKLIGNNVWDSLIEETSLLTKFNS